MLNWWCFIFFKIQYSKPLNHIIQLNKWYERPREREIVLQNEISNINKIHGSSLQDVEYHCQIHEMSLHGLIYPNDQAASQSCHFYLFQEK